MTTTWSVHIFPLLTRRTPTLTVILDEIMLQSSAAMWKSDSVEISAGSVFISECLRHWALILQCKHDAGRGFPLFSCQIYMRKGSPLVCLQSCVAMCCKFCCCVLRLRWYIGCFGCVSYILIFASNIVNVVE